jgi:hypothetical protein
MGKEKEEKREETNAATNSKEKNPKGCS